MINAKAAEMEERRQKQAQEQDVPKENERVGLNEVGVFDTDLYTGGKSKFEGYHTHLAIDDGDEEEEAPQPQKRTSYTAPLALLNDVAQAPDDFDPFAEHKRPKIVDREDEYRKQRRNAIISPARVDPFANGGATPDIGSRGYSQIMREQNLRAEEADYQKQMREKAKEGTLKVVEKPAAPKRRGRWDMTTEETPSKTKKTGSTTPTAPSDSSTTPAHLNPWDATPGRREFTGAETPGALPPARMWDPTPAHVTPGHHGSGSETPAAGNFSGFDKRLKKTNNDLIKRSCNSRKTESMGRNSPHRTRDPRPRRRLGRNSPHRSSSRRKNHL